MKSLSELIKFVRGYIGEERPGYWSDSEIINNINRAKDDLWEAIETVNKQMFLKSFSFTTNGELDFQLPDDFSSLETIRASDNSVNFIPYDIGFQKFQESINLSVNNLSFFAVYYDIVSKLENGYNKWFIKFSPVIPNGKNIIIEYISRPPDLINSSDNLGIFDKYYGYIVDKATYYTLLKGPSGEYEKWLQNSEIKLNRILSSLRFNNYKSEFVEGFLED